jgi:D-alanyl-lipoteichoic acid acyltransferase DltB (MBOAT superfamily)
VLFSSPIFLFLFLPVVLAGYAAASFLGRTAQNLWLLAASVLFYAWGEGNYTLVLLASMLMNFGFGLLVDRVRGRGRVEGAAIGLAVAANLGLIAYFKYEAFLVDAVERLPPGLGAGALDAEAVHLPIGASRACSCSATRSSKSRSTCSRRTPRKPTATGRSSPFPTA